MRRNELARRFAFRNAFAAALAVVHAVVVSLRERIFTHRTPRVIGDVINVRREKTLIRFMHARGDVGPPEKGLGQRCAIVGAHLEFHIRFAGMQEARQTASLVD